MTKFQLARFFTADLSKLRPSQLSQKASIRAGSAQKPDQSLAYESNYISQYHRRRQQNRLKNRRQESLDSYQGTSTFENRQSFGPDNSASFGNKYKLRLRSGNGRINRYRNRGHEASRLRTIASEKNFSQNENLSQSGLNGEQGAAKKLKYGTGLGFKALKGALNRSSLKDEKYGILKKREIRVRFEDIHHQDDEAHDPNDSPKHTENAENGVSRIFKESQKNQNFGESGQQSFKNSSKKRHSRQTQPSRGSETLAPPNNPNFSHSKNFQNSGSAAFRNTRSSYSAARMDSILGSKLSLTSSITHDVTSHASGKVTKNKKFERLINNLSSLRLAKLRANNKIESFEESLKKKAPHFGRVNKKIMSNQEMMRMEMIFNKFKKSNFFKKNVFFGQTQNPASRRTSVQFRAPKQPQGSPSNSQLGTNPPNAPNLAQNPPKNFNQAITQKTPDYHLHNPNDSETDNSKHPSEASKNFSLMETSEAVKNDNFWDYRNYNIISLDDANFCDRIVRNMPFFCRFEKNVRMIILLHSELVKYKRGEFIFHEGDPPNSVYIILFGMCTAKIRAKFPGYEKEIYQVVATLTDGTTFGDFSLLEGVEDAETDIGSVVDQVFSARFSLGVYGMEVIKRVEGLRDVTKLKMYREVLRECDRRNSKDFIKKEIRGFGVAARAVVNGAGDAQRANFGDIIGSGEKKIGKIDEEQKYENSQKGQKVGKKGQKAEEVEIGDPEGVSYKPRSAGIYVAQDCLLLKIPSTFFTKRIKPLILNNLQRKIQLLKRIPFLHKLGNVHKLIISNVMRKRIYKLGEPIIQQGTYPISFVVISKGICKVIWRRKMTLRKKLKKKVILRDEPLKDFRFSELRRDVQKDRKDGEWGPERVYKHSRLYFQNDVAESVDDSRYSFFKNFDIKILKSGDILGLRSFLAKDVTLNGNIVKGKHPEIEAAIYDVVSDCAQLEVFELSKSHFHYVPDNILVSFQLRNQFFHEFFEFEKNEFVGDFARFITLDMVIESR